MLATSIISLKPRSIVKPNYSGNRKRKEEARKKKQEDKRNKRLNIVKLVPVVPPSD